MSFIKEFKVFIARGNMVDLAIAVILGAAFGKVVSSFVNDVIMPPIGLLLGGVDFNSLAVTLKQPTGNQPGVAIKYGIFINTLIDFIIISFVVFWLVKGVNRLKEKPAPSTKECPECLMAIPLNAKKCGHCTSSL